MPKTYLGQFLYSERIRRGYESSITEYLKNYVNILPISEPYYRDIESGRKIIRIDTAEALCNALNLDKIKFYYHLLNDILPLDVLEKLLNPIPLTIFNSASEEFNKLDEKRSILRKAYGRSLFTEPYIVSDEIVKYLNDNFEVLPLIHFVYMKRKCSFEELQKIIQKNNITKSFKQIIEEFKKNKIAIINNQEKTITRYSKIFRIPRNDIGTKFKDKFFKTEINEIINLINSGQEREQKISPNNTYIYSAIICRKSRESLERISNKLIELFAEFDAEENSLDEEGTVPYFVSIIFSSREKYDVKNENNIKNKLKVRKNKK